MITLILINHEKQAIMNANNIKMYEYHAVVTF
jgi:hypothetical protein